MLPRHLDRRGSRDVVAEKLAAANRNLRLDEAAVQVLLGSWTRYGCCAPGLGQVAEVAAFLTSNQAARDHRHLRQGTSGTFPSQQVGPIQDAVAAAPGLTQDGAWVPVERWVARLVSPDVDGNAGFGGWL
jgi:hypothetical protein